MNLKNILIKCLYLIGSIFVLTCVAYCFNSYVGSIDVVRVMIKEGIVDSMKYYWDTYLPFWILCITSMIILSIMIISFSYLIIKDVKTLISNNSLKSTRKAKKKARLEKKLEELEGE